MSEDTEAPVRWYAVVYRESDRLLASAFDTNVPILGYAEVPSP